MLNRFQLRSFAKMWIAITALIFRRVPELSQFDVNSGDLIHIVMVKIADVRMVEWLSTLESRDIYGLCGHVTQMIVDELTMSALNMRKRLVVMSKGQQEALIKIESLYRDDSFKDDLMNIVSAYFWGYIDDEHLEDE